MPPNEVEIKAIILQKWRSMGIVSRKTIIATEYVLGSNGRRVDLATNGSEFVGVEIKSDYDTLERLTDQIAIYEHCFDRVVVVCGSRHISRCVAELPPHIEVWQITPHGTLVKAKDASIRLVPDRNIII